MEETEYDDAGRPVEVKFLGNGDEEWSTTTEYGGDRVTVTPPQGGTKTTAINTPRRR